MKHIKEYQEYIKENGITMNDPQTMNCPSCGVELDPTFYKTAPIPRECVGCGEDVEEVLNRKDWNWA